jgi:TonB-dependent SusC/RagA subfamily outer membrane receptor
MRSRLVSLAAVVALAGALAVPTAGADAQGTGTVRGTVKHAQSGAPVANAQVFVAGTQLGAVTNAQGAFQINAVPAGAQTLRVRMIGFLAYERSITVTEGTSIVADLAITPSAVSLDEVVVTGTAGQARKREIGNAIAAVKLDEAPEARTNVSNLLAGRVAGVSVLNSAGVIGAGSSIRLRGNTSVSLSNQPLIYIDGVRVRSDEYPKNVPPVGSNLRSSHVNGSPLNDINPDDIDRVEILKGAAAATLYGTEAAAGVIQIFTKKGTSGKAQWVAQTRQGFAQERPFGTDAVPYMFMDPWLRRGGQHNYSGSVAGGANILRYFTSGSFDANQGVLPNDEEKKYVMRGNFNFAPTSKLNIEWTTGYTNDNLQQTPAGNNAHGLTLNAFRRQFNYFGDSSVKTISQVLDFKLNTYIDRFTLGTTATFTPLANFTHKLTVGTDRAEVENRQYRPFGFPGAAQGIISDDRWVNRIINLDYVGNWDWQPKTALKSTFSWGAQSAQSDVQQIQAYSENFPGPFDPTVSLGSARQGFEPQRTRVVNAGFFLQELVGFRDKYFLTFGLRVDGNSAFGSDFGLQQYPKVSASYVLSDEGFWNPKLGTLKLRAAYGEAGRAPGAFDAVRTWDPAGWGGLSAVRPFNLGSPTLGPERSKEIEAGFDGAALEGRVSYDFTYYRSRTVDALLRIRRPPSEGNWSDQLENVGTLEKNGIEASLNGTLLERKALTWTAGVTVATNHSEAVDIGGVAAFPMTGNGFGYIAEGQPVPVIRAKLIRNAGAVRPVAAGDTVSNYFFGPAQPTRIINLSSAITVWKGIELSARGEYQGGHYLDEDASFQALSRAVEWPTCQGAYEKIKADQRDRLTVREQLWCVQQNVRSDMFIYPADFFKLRDVSLRIPLGKRIPRTQSAHLVLSAGNWFTWKRKEFPVFDPEQAGNDGFNAGVRYISEHIPAPATFMTQVRVVF